MDALTTQRGRGADRTFPRLRGGRLGLDFVNTIESPLDAHEVDFPRQYADLGGWSRHAGILDNAAIGRQPGRATRRPPEPAGVFAHAMELRTALTRLFRAVAHGDVPAPEHVELIQLAYSDALTHARLPRRASSHVWHWPSDPVVLEYPLWAVARSALDLPIGGDLRRIKQCRGVDDRGWLFYDESKNGRRQWCGMEGCGSRAKMRRYYARQRAATQPRACGNMAMAPGRTALVAGATGAWG